MLAALLPAIDIRQFVAPLVDLYLVVTVGTILTMTFGELVVSTGGSRYYVGETAVEEWQAFGFVALVFAIALLLAQLIISVLAGRLGLTVLNRFGLILVLLWLFGVARTDLLLVPENPLVRFGVVGAFWALLHRPILTDQIYLLLGGLLTFLAFYQEVFDFLGGIVRTARQ